MSQTAEQLRRLIDGPPRLVACGFMLCGALLTTAFAPFGLYLLAPLCALPVFLGSLWSSPRRSAWYAFAFGVGLFASGTYWIYVSVHVFGRAPLWIALLLMSGLVLIMASYCGLIGWLLARLGRGNAWRLALVGPAIWVLIEWLRGWLLSGFPWLSFGYGQTDSLLAGWAPVIGVYGVSWMVLVSAVGFVPLLVMRSGRVAAVSLIALPWFFGGVLQFASWTESSGVARTTTIVQGGVPQDRKWLSEQFIPTVNLYRNALLAAEKSTLIVWPEVAIPAVTTAVESYLQTLQQDLRARGQTLALGILEPHANGTQVYNSVLMLDGRSTQSYRKRHLVPFGEYFPVPDVVRGWMRLLSLPNNDMHAGADRQPLLVAADGTRFAAAICYEDAYGAEQLAALPEAEILINVSNDAWFGESIAPHQHLQVARMRALEVGRWMVRATNNGISAFIDPRGEITAIAPQFEFATLTASIEPRSGTTPYAATGNAPLLLLLAGVVGVVAWRERRAESMIRDEQR